MNQCAETCIKDIALVGKKNGWILMVGGCGTGKPRLADTIAEDLNDEDALAMIDKVIACYQTNAKPKARVGRFIDRIGLDEFKSAIL